MTAVRGGKRGTAPAADADGLVAWAEASGRQRPGGPAPGGLRFAFYGRVSTEDWQDPVTSRARQREQAETLVRGHGVIAAEFFDAGQSRTVAWARRPEAAALVALLADPGRGWGAVVVGEYERAFAALMTRRRGRELEQWMIAAAASGEPSLRSLATGLRAD